MGTTFMQLFEKLPFHILAFVSFLTFIILLYSWLNTKNQLPSPRKLPIIGNLHQLGKLPHRSLQSLSRKHGDLMLLHLGSKPTLVVSSPDAAEEVMKTHDAVFSDRPVFKVASVVAYYGRDIVFAKYGEYWRQIKSICVMHMLSNIMVKSFRKIREEETSQIVECIKMSAPTVQLNLTDCFASYTNDVVSRAAFGRKYDRDEGCGNIKELLNEVSKVIGAGNVGDFIPWLGWIDHLTGVLRTATRVANAFDSFLDRIVQEHIDRFELQSRDKDEVDKSRDLVDVLLGIQRNDPHLHRDTVKALLLDMLAAGIETTSTLLEWTMSELLLHPESMKRLQDEVRGLAKGKTIIDEDDLKNMKYLTAVIKESLRLHPPLPLLLFRESSQNTKICNYDIAAGTMVIINAWAIQRQPALWDEPEEFQPERFLNNPMDMNGTDFKFIPFGAGRRGCPGISFATVEAELILANLIARFDWKLPPGEVQCDAFLAESFGASVRKRDPLIAIPTPYLFN
ncbi:hypothetical protein vseg_010348 [Gypsophila vaccaria]